MYRKIRQTTFWPQGALALIASILFVYLLLSPFNLPLYTLVMFPCPDPRTSNMDAQFKQLRTYNATEKDVSFRSADGSLLKGWFLEVPNTKRVFLVSHGKGNNIYGKLHHAPLLLRCGGSVLQYDYRGFGKSEGRITIDGACDDAVAAYDYLIEHEHRSPRDIIAFGESFGTGVTGQLVERRPLGGVILQSGFTSLVRAGRDRFFWLKLYPDAAFPKAMAMDNVAVFSKKHPPLLIVHGKKDKTLAYENAEDLYQKSIEPKTLFTVPNGGHCCFGSPEEFTHTVKDFLRENDL